MQLRLLMLATVLGAAALLPAGARAQATETGPDTVLFTPKRGNVTFTHGKHAKLTDCVTCHHESKSEKPLESKQQKCTACHTNPATEPVKTSLRNAMHDTVNKEGLCYSCHNKELAAGKPSPAKCAECHKQEG